MQDSCGRQFKDPATEGPDPSLIFLLQTHLEEQMGGMLCLGHYYLPQFKTKYSRGRWVVQISCCCACQMQSLEDRLKEIFPV
jgi:hypothetical protein